MSDLPNDILEKIFFTLSARSLARLSLVCKQWRSFISDPKFVRDHTHRVVSDQSSHNLFTVWRTTTDDGPWKNLVNSVILKSIDKESLNTTNFELKFLFPVTHAVLCCCNGLWLVDRYYVHRSKYWFSVLWNPLLGQNYKGLPESNFHSSYVKYFQGFGYAPFIDDYKVVRLYAKPSNGHYPQCYSKLEVEVYSLKTNSWKIIPGVPRTKITIQDRNYTAGTHVKGSVYWTVYNNAAVLAFDLITEKFKWLEIPYLNDYDDVKCTAQTEILQVRGCLGAYRSGCYYKDTVIWIRNEDENKKGYWTKLLTIPTNDRSLIRGLFFMNNNEVLLHVAKDYLKKFVIYDSAHMTFRDIPCRDVKWPVYTVETLVSPCFF